MDRETAERAADSAMFGATLLMQGQLMRAALELAELHPTLLENRHGFPVSLEEFVRDFCRETGGITEGRAREFVQFGRVNP